jgi:hypothetical protein
MEVQFSDYNEAKSLLERSYRSEFTTLAAVLGKMPLHLKDSDQRGKEGTPIFNPVGTNSYIKQGLAAAGWGINLSIPEKFAFLGTDVDFFKNGLLCEAQFSNYPFLLNNLLRSELFFKSRTTFQHLPVTALAIITKAHMFPASNSTLYYEQAMKQIGELSNHHVFGVPIRLIGLFLPETGRHEAVWTRYREARYSRTIVEERRRTIEVSPPTSRNGPVSIQYI